MVKQLQKLYPNYNFLNEKFDSCDFSEIGVENKINQYKTSQLQIDCHTKQMLAQILQLESLRDTEKCDDLVEEDFVADS